MYLLSLGQMILLAHRIENKPTLFYLAYSPTASQGGRSNAHQYAVEHIILEAAI
jgi:hypothetical protein